MSAEQNVATENGSSSLRDYSQHSPVRSAGQIQQYAKSLLNLLNLSDVMKQEVKTKLEKLGSENSL